ncbi:MAG: zinc ribbon domain-containing protein [Deltaproteobacteria bacterium]|nr:MAG: zinc ribbon domain-containing protein [Deltaproteobacteria bacterium]
MPIYAYKCQACGAEEEHLQKVSDPPVEQCASCGGPLVKQITGTSFKLVGGGWYKDLYSSPKPKSGESGSSGGKASGGEKAASA